MPELLAPAGNLEKLKTAVRYGADAVYLAGKRFGMRAAAENFTDEEMAEGILYAHHRGVKVYVTVNVSPRTEEYTELRDYLERLGALSPDALIVGDLGVLSLVREVLPTMPIHVSTQANVVSAATAAAWASLGASRIVLSRELSLSEIGKIRKALPEEIELEVFVHGAMCISYSGRCLLSNYLAGRDAGHGACTQPCRWHYRTLRIQAELLEEKRENEPLPVIEEGGETFFMSSRDLCMVTHIKALCDAGVASFKIEGRMKSAYYTAVITNAYRMAIDAIERSAPIPGEVLLAEVESVSHREYDTGFFFDSPHERAMVTERDGYLREKAYLGVVLAYDEASGKALFMQRNKLSCGDRVEILVPGKPGLPFLVEELFDEDMQRIEAVPHPRMRFWMRVPIPVGEGDLLRSAAV